MPSDPTELYVEDFENAPDHSNVSLGDYVGATGMTYTADPFWVSRPSCNGFIIDRLSPRNPADCEALVPPGSAPYNTLTALPHALGVLDGAADPDLNAAASSYTEGSSGANQVQFRTESPLTLSSAGRFITFSVDAAAQNCHALDPLLRFYLVDGADTEIPVSDAPINPCTDPRATDTTSPSQNGTTFAARVGRFTADSSVLVQGNTFGIVMRNEEGSGVGNDGAYDNIRVLDATPQLDKLFDPIQAPLERGVPTNLTFTVTNTSELAEKTGWGFVDALPAGLEVAGAPTTTCDAATIDAPLANGTITVTDGSLGTGDASCTVTVPVTSSTGGVFTNGPGNVTTTGLNEPGSSTTEYEVPTPPTPPTPPIAPVPPAPPTVPDAPDTRFDLVLSKTAASSQAMVGDLVRYRLEVSNKGPGAAPGPIKLVDRLPRGLELKSARGNGWDCEVRKASDTVACVRRGELGPDRTAAPVIVVAKATEAAVGRVVNTASVRGGDGETTPRNNRDIAGVRVVRVPPLPSTGFRVAPGAAWL